MEMREAEKFLREHAIRPSLQRVQIYKYLRENKTHPTVDMIYQDLHPNIPTFSKTTVYNTMKLFSEKGLVQTITIEEGEARFDGDTSYHGHFKCRGCDNIFDFFFDDGDSNVPMLPAEFEVEDLHFYGWGLCPSCKDS